MTDSAPRNGAVAAIDTSVAHASRVYDYMLGGTTNFEIDRAAAQHLADAIGGMEIARAHVRANRSFLVRAVRRLAGEGSRLAGEGIRQFLDVGTGVPNNTNTHAVAQECAPDSRIVCVDNDPVVLAHAHKLIRSTPEGAAAFIDADLRDPDHVLTQAADTLDFSQPIALMLVSIVHALGDHDDRHGLVSTLVDALPAGSYLAMSHLASDVTPAETEEGIRRLNENARETYVLCTAAEFTRFFEGLELVDPGITRVDLWGHDEAEPPDVVAPFHAGVARKP